MFKAHSSSTAKMLLAMPSQDITCWTEYSSNLARKTKLENCHPLTQQMLPYIDFSRAPSGFSEVVFDTVLAHVNESPTFAQNPASTVALLASYKVELKFKDGKCPIDDVLLNKLNAAIKSREADALKEARDLPFIEGVFQTSYYVNDVFFDGEEEDNHSKPYIMTVLYDPYVYPDRNRLYELLTSKLPDFDFELLDKPRCWDAYASNPIRKTKLENCHPNTKKMLCFIDFSRAPLRSSKAVFDAVTAHVNNSPTFTQDPQPTIASLASWNVDLKFDGKCLIDDLLLDKLRAAMNKCTDDYNNEEISRRNSSDAFTRARALLPFKGVFQTTFLCDGNEEEDSDTKPYRMSILYDPTVYPDKNILLALLNEKLPDFAFDLKEKPVSNDNHKEIEHTSSVKP